MGRRESKRRVVVDQERRWKNKSGTTSASPQFSPLSTLSPPSPLSLSLSQTPDAHGRTLRTTDRGRTGRPSSRGPGATGTTTTPPPQTIPHSTTKTAITPPPHPISAGHRIPWRRAEKRSLRTEGHEISAVWDAVPDKGPIRGYSYAPSLARGCPPGTTRSSWTSWSSAQGDWAMGQHRRP